MSIQTSRDWKARPEGGGFFALWLIRTIAKRLGWRVARPLLWPITAYFLWKRGPERRASIAWLGRVLGRPATLRDGARHVHTFASTILDRVFLLGGDLDRYQVDVRGLDQLHALLDQNRGVLLFGSHLGSFDVLRVLATRRPDYILRVVLDKSQNPALTRLLDALNPTLAASIIDAAQDGPVVAMEMKRALDEGALVAMLVDRARPDEPSLPAPFVGGHARFPTTPWLLAAVLKVPVALGFGLYRGGRHYDLRFETFEPGVVDIPRADRAKALSLLIQRYAGRLETMARDAPYNWFNFYDFWEADDAAGPRALEDAAVQRRTLRRRIADGGGRQHDDAGR
ncbi:acyltransferase [Lysobacter pythonis]|uniref:Acyltransferase n=1 Tax=Solilutibacter pythonis TaxID=2483112 RepID=A0A3M2I3C0_9GAMM|nr:acyltransferase [Lysobacter pythonis]RMH93722.1 acyltransferase [Lysobacter pythonis]